MFPYWIGLNARTLMEINSVWLRSTADLMGLFLPPPARGTACLRCQCCSTVMDLTTSRHGRNRPYLRCPNCGLLGLHRPTAPQGRPTRPGRQWAAGGRYRAL